MRIFLVSMRCIKTFTGKYSVLFLKCLIAYLHIAIHYNTSFRPFEIHNKTRRNAAFRQQSQKLCCKLSVLPFLAIVIIIVVVSKLRVRILEPFSLTFLSSYVFAIRGSPESIFQENSTLFLRCHVLKVFFRGYFLREPIREQ